MQACDDTSFNGNNVSVICKASKGSLHVTFDIFTQLRAGHFLLISCWWQFLKTLSMVKKCTIKETKIYLQLLLRLDGREGSTKKFCTNTHGCTVNSLLEFQHIWRICPKEAIIING